MAPRKKAAAPKQPITEQQPIIEESAIKDQPIEQPEKLEQAPIENTTVEQPITEQQKFEEILRVAISEINTSAQHLSECARIMKSMKRHSGTMAHYASTLNELKKSLSKYVKNQNSRA